MFIFPLQVHIPGFFNLSVFIRQGNSTIEFLVNLTLSLAGLLGEGSKGEVGGKFAKLEGPSSRRSLTG
jgi:uncharacterized membrane protein YqaE (UPF0057 family)